MAEAVRRAQLELKAFREREAKTKAEAAAAAKVQQETEARIKLEAMRKAALKIELRKSKTQYDDAPRPLYTFKQNAKNVTLLVQVPAVRGGSPLRYSSTANSGALLRHAPVRWVVAKAQAAQDHQ